MKLIYRFVCDAIDEDHLMKGPRNMMKFLGQ